jgi:hypothetical protein
MAWQASVACLVLVALLGWQSSLAATDNTIGYGELEVLDTQLHAVGPPCTWTDASACAGGVAWRGHPPVMEAPRFRIQALPQRRGVRPHHQHCEATGFMRQRLHLGLCTHVGVYACRPSLR